MSATTVSIEDQGDVLLAWCSPIADEQFLLQNTKLTPLEREKLQSFIANRRRIEWLTTRWLLQQTRFKEETIEYHWSGKPELNNSDLSISISHCKEIVAIAIHSKGKSIGIDCETIESRILKIKHKFTNEQEFSHINKNELENLSLVWCAKEALFKLYAKGEVNFNVDLQVNNFDFCSEGGTFTGTISKEKVEQYNIQYKHIQNSLLVWVSE
jgi:phosphopantetheinyl transferase